MKCDLSIRSISVLTLFSSILLFNLLNSVSSAIDDKYCTCENVPRKKPTRDDGRILNGTRNGTEVLNYVAMLYFKYYDFQSAGQPALNRDKEYFYVPFCSGVVINPYYVLTAGHCLEAVEARPDLLSTFFVAAGLDHQLNRTLTSAANFKQVERIHKHPDYTKNETSDGTEVTNDIGLVKLASRFEFGTDTGILPACMLDEHDVRNLTKDRESYGPDLFLAGYGRTVITRPGDLSRSLKGSPPEDLLKALAGPLYSDVHNFTYFQTNYLWLTTVQQNATCLNKDSYCVYSETASNCFGDSGGPLLWWHVHSLYVVGLQSGGERKTVDNVTYSCYPGVVATVTQIYPYAAWLRGIIGREKCIMDF